MELQSVWGWQPALYLFLGGMGAGAFIMAAILYAREKGRSEFAVCVSMWAAVASLAVGLLLLLMELVVPLRGLLMWQSFSHFTSWMTYGAWGAFCAIAVFGLSALLATPPVGAALRARWACYAAHERGVRSALAAIGAALGVFVAFYTGMLLMTAGGVPFWETPLLPALFTVSAFDTGVALVEVVAVLSARRGGVSVSAKRFMERCVVALVLIEAAVLAAFLGSAISSGGQGVKGAAAAASADMFLSGRLAPWFWALVVAIGLVVPFAMAVRGLLRKEEPAVQEAPARATAQGAVAVCATAQETVAAGGRVVSVAMSSASTVEAGDGRPFEGAGNVPEAPSAQCGAGDCVSVASLAGPIGALIGGCALRFLVLAAGVHADIVAETIFAMID